MAEPSDLYDFVACENIDEEPFEFTIDSQPYYLNVGEIRAFPKFMARLLVKHLTDKILNKRDPEGKAIRNQAMRDEVAARIVVEEKPLSMPRAMSQAEKNNLMVEQMNKSSDLDEVLKRRKGQLHAAEPKEVIEPTPTAPVVKQPTPTPIVPPPAPDLSKVKPSNSTDDFAGLPKDDESDNQPKQPPAIADGEAPKVPSRDTLMTYAKNTLKLDMNDKKTMDSFTKMSDEDLAIELGYPVEEE